MPSDIWAVGCVIFEMCLLHPPFTDDDKIKNEPPPAIPILTDGDSFDIFMDGFPFLIFLIHISSPSL